MKNTPKSSAKSAIHSYIKAISTIGAAIIITLAAKANPTSTAVQKEIAEIFKKNPDKEIIVKVESEQKNTENVANFETLGNDTNNALTFAANNVDQYYPDMKEHLTTMMNSFRDEEHRSATIKLLDEMAANISDPAQKTGAIIYALEGVFRENQSFSLKYDEDITDETFAYIETFDTEYTTRFKGYYARLVAQTEQLQQKLQESQQKLQESQQKLQESQQKLQESEQELEKGRQEFEAIIIKFPPEEIKINPSLKELTKKTEQRFVTNHFTPSTELQKRFDAAK